MNIINAAFVRNGVTVRTLPVYQYNRGMILKISGLYDLPATFRADFSNAETGQSKSVIGTDGEVHIPYEYFVPGATIHCWLVWTGADYAVTKRHIMIPVARRATPTDEEPTPDEQGVIDQAIAKLNDAVGQTGQDVETAAGYAEQAEQSAQAAIDAKDAAVTAKADAEAAKDQASQSSTSAAASAQSASESAQSASQSKADAQAAAASVAGAMNTLEATIQADLQAAKESGMFDGADGVSPTVTVTPTIGGHQVMITDAEGEHTFDVPNGNPGVDGFSPIATVTQTQTGATISITDKAGTTTAQISNGAKGDPGEVTQAEFDDLAGDVADLKSQIEEKADIKDSTKIGVDLDISDPNGNVIFRIADGHIQTKKFNSADKQSDATILTVKSSGGDYTGIRAAVEAAAAAGASAENPYIIQIAPGTYDILSEFSSEEIAASGFVGLMITNGITLEGMGTLRDDTVLYAEMDTTVYDTTKRNDVSTLNFRGSVGLKNLTVKSKNMRYGIHDDFSYSSDKPKIRRLENCNIYAEATTSWNIGNVSYGAGTDGNKIFIFDDCDLGDTVLIHTDVGPYSNMVIMHHCRCFQFIAKDYASTAVNRYYLYGCDFKWIRQNHVGDAWTSQHLFMLGDVKGAYVEGYAGMQYELGDSYRVQQSPVTSYPKAVTSADTGRYHIQTTSSADAVTGILYYYDTTEGYSLVQTGGWMCAELLGFAAPTVGQYLVVGSSGALSLSDSDSNSIGKVVFVNENGKHFIKLGI